MRRQRFPLRKDHQSILQDWRRGISPLAQRIRILAFAKAMAPLAGKGPLTFLRGHGRYLTPGSGIDFWTGIADVIRTTLLNLLIWIPLFAVLFWGLLMARDYTINALEGWPSPLPEWITP
jgi:hypothetical protein